MTKRCYIFDIDGTTADCSHRLHFSQSKPKNWNAAFAACADDTPIPHICALAQLLAAGANIVFVTGRPKRCRNDTELWLWQHVARTAHDLSCGRL